MFYHYSSTWALILFIISHGSKRILFLVIALLLFLLSRKWHARCIPFIALMTPFLSAYFWRNSCIVNLYLDSRIIFIITFFFIILQCLFNISWVWDLLIIFIYFNLLFILQINFFSFTHLLQMNSFEPSFSYAFPSRDSFSISCLFLFSL